MGLRPTEMMLLLIIEYTMLETIISMTRNMAALMRIGAVLTFLPASELAIFWMAGGTSVLSGSLK